MSKKEELANKTLKEIDNIWEMIAFLFYYKGKEWRNTIILIQFVIIIIMFAKYTKIFETLFNWILR